LLSSKESQVEATNVVNEWQDSVRRSKAMASMSYEQWTGPVETSASGPFRHRACYPTFVWPPPSRMEESGRTGRQGGIIMLAGTWPFGRLPPAEAEGEEETGALRLVAAGRSSRVPGLMEKFDGEEREQKQWAGCNAASLALQALPHRSSCLPEHACRLAGIGSWLVMHYDGDQSTHNDPSFAVAQHWHQANTAGPEHEIPRSLKLSYRQQPDNYEYLGATSLVASRPGCVGDHERRRAVMGS
jgi:hypothetical protein